MITDRVLNEQGNLRPHVNIFLNDDKVRRKQLLDTNLPKNCEITILPSVSGGSDEENGEWSNRKTVKAGLQTAP